MEHSARHAAAMDGAAHEGRRLVGVVEIAMTRALTAEVADKIKSWEGLRLNAYTDSAGVLTIGYGHTGPDVRAGLMWTQAQADAAFDEDTQLARACVESSVTQSLSDQEFGALVSFTFNVGCNAFKSSTLLKKLNAGDYASVPAELSKWVYVTVAGKKVQSTGLTNRRNAEGGLWVGGSYVASSSISPDPPTPWYKTPRVKALTTAAAGVSGTAITSAATQVQGLIPYGKIFLWAFVGLSAVGVLWGIFRHQDSQ